MAVSGHWQLRASDDSANKEDVQAPLLGPHGHGDQIQLGRCEGFGPWDSEAVGLVVMAEGGWSLQKGPHIRDDFSHHERRSQRSRNFSPSFSSSFLVDNKSPFPRRLSDKSIVSWSSLLLLPLAHVQPLGNI